MDYRRWVIMENSSSPDQEIADGQSCDGDYHGNHDDVAPLEFGDLEMDDIRAFEEFRKLSQLFHELPKDMCVLQIVM